jgi:hypothetical protein
MHGRLELTHGVVSAHVPVGGYADAAIANGDDSIAGIELEVDNVVVSARDTPDYPARASQILTVSMHKATMLALALLLLEKLGTPAFTEPEWRIIEDVLRSSAAKRPRELAERIHEAYS